MKATARQHDIHLDWLRFSVPDNTNIISELPLHKAFNKTGELLEPLPNYNAALALLCCRVDWNTERPEQRMLVTMTGKDLERMRSLGLSEKNLLQDVSEIQGLHISRMDIACDTTDTRLSPAEIKKDFASGRFETRARSISEITKTGEGGAYQGHTVYVGSRQSEQFLRVYDKAAEQGTEGHLTRLELELKGQKAFEALHAILRYGEGEAALAAFNRFFRWSNAAWQDIVSGLSVSVDKLAVDAPDKREEWLMRVAMPAVIKAIKDGNKNVKESVFRELGLVARKVDLTWY